MERDFLARAVFFPRGKVAGLNLTPGSSGELVRLTEARGPQYSAVQVQRHIATRLRLQTSRLQGPAGTHLDTMAYVRTV